MKDNKYTNELSVFAPYNFVGVSEKVNKKDRIQPHNVIDGNLLDGKIEYEIEALTPICVEDGKGNFYRDCYGNLALPGSSVRGLVRGNVQILSCSSVADDIQNNHLMYRDIASKSGGYSSNRKIYADILGADQETFRGADGKTVRISVLRNVKAGYLRCAKGRYEIIPAVEDPIGNKKGEMNYYVLNERMIITSGFNGFKYLKNYKYRGHYLLQNMEDPQDPRRSFTRISKGPRVSYKGRPNRDYHPYFIPVSYQTKPDGSKVTGVDAPGKLALQGCLLSSGYMQQKKAIYLIPAMDKEAAGIPIPQESVDSFRRDYAARRNQVESMDKTFFALPKEGDSPKPVFYIEEGGRLYFGFTPRLRLFYNQDIFAGLPQAQKNAGLDYSKSLFGFTGDAGSYRGRLSFSDARAMGETEEGRERSVIPGEPKPTSFVNYLRPVKGPGVVSYNDTGHFLLRGVKQYWLKKGVFTPDYSRMKNKNVFSVLHPLDKGAKFEGKIRFENLTRRELGMVLWGLLLEENSNQNIGKGKPFGLGRIALRLKGLYLEEKEGLYGGDSLCLAPYREASGEAKALIAEAKEDMKAFLGHDVTEEPSIRDFLLMKDAAKIPPADRTRYMALEEYGQQRQDAIPLPDVEDVIKGQQLRASAPAGGQGNHSGQKNPSSQGYGKGQGYRKTR